MIRRLVVSALVAGGIWLAVPSAEAAGSVIETGWWTRRSGASAQPNGGFEVASALGEHQSVAAVRVQVEEPVGEAILVLDESGGVGAERATLRVCPAEDTWRPANPGPFASAPKADCTKAVDLTRDAGARKWRGDVRSLLRGSRTSLLVVPGAPVLPAAQVTFAKATLEATTLAPVTPSEPQSETPPFVTDVAPETAPVEPAPVPETPVAPVDAEVPAPVVEAPAAAVAGSAAAAPEAATPGFAVGPAGGPGGPDRPWGRLLLLVPFSAAIGVAAARGNGLLRARL